MCKTKRHTIATEPHPRSSIRTHHSYPSTTNTTTNTNSGTHNQASTSSASSTTSLSSLQSSLPDRPLIYPFAEIRLATNNFLSKRLSSSSWRCTLRGRDAVIFQRTHRGGDLTALGTRLSTLCRSHHRSVVRLLGISLAGGHIYLAYEHIPGASLADCLRNPRNPTFTPLSTWLSRMKIAADLANGLEYIHTQTATVHNKIKSSGIIVTEPRFLAKICHFGAADLAGEIGGGRRDRIEGSKGYMSPEVIAGGEISQGSDVFAFGVVILELLSGSEAVRCSFDLETGGVERSSVVEAAREVMGPEAVEERRVRIRRWVDRRMKDSFPVEVAERLIRVALRCVEAEQERRPEMTYVAAKVSEMLLMSEKWGEKFRVPADISVSLAPR